LRFLLDPLDDLIVALTSDAMAFSTRLMRKRRRRMMKGMILTEI